MDQRVDYKSWESSFHTKQILENRWTIRFASSIGLSASAMWSEPLLNASTFVRFDEYTLFWNNVTKVDHSKRYNASMEYVWIKIVDVTNELCRSIFLRNLETQSTIVHND